MYTDKNFPLMLEHEATLKDSMKNLGYSRADFWAFAGLIALDEVQRKTKGICTFWDWTYTCKENGCYTQLPDDFLKLFKSGRSDCQPKDPNDLKHLYLTDKVEAHPDKNQNGPKTVNTVKIGLTSLVKKDWLFWAFIRLEGSILNSLTGTMPGKMECLNTELLCSTMNTSKHYPCNQPK